MEGQSPNIRLAIDAASADSGGGLVVLLGYLQSWGESAAPLDIMVFASRPHVIEAVRELRPDVTIVPFAVEASVPARVWSQIRDLGRAAAGMGAEAILTTNMTLDRCTIPQLTLHQNLLLFEEPVLWRNARFGLNRLVRAYLAQRALRRATTNLFISDYLRKIAEAIVPESAPRNRTLFNGLPQSVIDAAGESDWDGQPRLLAVTSADPHKDNETALQVLKLLRERAPDLDWRLEIAHTGRLDREKARAGQLGLSASVEFLGTLTPKQLAARYRRAHCLIFPSRIEGFGIPVVEAMAYGCPVVACHATALPEVVADAGMLVAAGDASGFADAALHLFEDRSLRERMVRAGARRASGFGWSRSAAGLLDAIVDAVGARR